MATVKDLKDQGDQLFSKRSALMSLWQEIADHFYPERADFTFSRHLGSEFVEHLMTSFPVLVRRDLGNAFTSMLRDKSRVWFHIRATDEGREDTVARRWLEDKTMVQRRAMYDVQSGFVRSTKEADHDFAAFGQGVLGLRLNKNRNGLLYRNHHLRDVAWIENEEGKIDQVHRRWMPSALVLAKFFRPGQLHQKVVETANQPNQKKFQEFNVRHIVMPSEDFGDAKFNRFPFVSIYLDVDNTHMIEVVGANHFEYIIPRWQTVSGSQYAYSPATVVGLADARLIQAMTRVLLESGEKAVNPPMVATEEVVRSDISLYAGGVTWVDQEYDERLGEALRPISQNTSGIPIGLEMLQDLRNQMANAFFINKLGLPQIDKEATAFEISQRVQEFIRSAMPLFEPMEAEYNGQICESTFHLLLENGAFGSVRDIPPSLRGADVEFKFESPFHDSIEAMKGNEFLRAKQLLAESVEIDPTVIAHLDVHTALRDALEGVGVPSRWIKEIEVANEEIAAIQEQQAAAALQQNIAQGADVFKTAAQGEQALNATQEAAG